MQAEFKKRRNLFSTLTLIAFMLATKPKENEKEESEFCNKNVFGATDPNQLQLLENHLTDLKEAGYIEIDEKGNPQITKWGTRVALQATSDSPNFKHLARENVNVAFSMFFAAASALQEHIKDQKIVAGKSGDLVNNLQAVKAWIEEKL